MMINILKKTSGRFTAMLMAVCLLTVAVITPFTPATSTAEAATVNNIILDDSMIDSFTVAVKGADAEGDEYAPCPEEGACDVSVYDMLRLTIGFHIPAGTLSTSKNTVDAYLELDGDKDGWLHAMAGLYGEQKGNIIINGEEAGTYSVRIRNPSGENTPYDDDDYHYVQPSVDSKRQYRIRVRFEFNQQTVERNQTNTIDNGILYFDLDAYWLGQDGAQPTIGFNTHTQTMNVQGIHLTIDKEAIGEPHYNKDTKLIEQQWKITVSNNGTLALPRGWQLIDWMFNGEAPPPDTSSSVPAGIIQFSGFEGLPFDKSLPASLPHPRPEGSYVDYSSSRSTTESLLLDSGWQNLYLSYSEKWNMDTLAPNKTIEYTYTTYIRGYSSLTDSTITNRIHIKPNTKYYPELVWDTASVTFHESVEDSPYLSVKKTIGNTVGINCVEGEEKCLTQTTWKTTITNTGLGTQYPTWQIVDQLNRSSTSSNSCAWGSKYSWYRSEDIEGMITALEEQNISAELDSIELCGMPETADNGWYHTADIHISLEDAYNQQLVVGIKLNIKSPLQSKESITINYTSTSKGYGWTGERTYENSAQACVMKNSTWYCYSSSTDKQVRSIQYLATECSGGQAEKYRYSVSYGQVWLGDPSSYRGEVGSCVIYSTIASVNRGQPITFHTHFDPYESKSNGVPKTFTLLGSNTPVCSSKSATTCWNLKSPSLVGESTTRTVDNGATTITITKTGDADWDITFHTPDSNSYYYNTISTWLMFVKSDFDDSAWKILNEKDPNSKATGTVTTVNATSPNGVMDLTDKAQWYLEYYNHGSKTAVKTKVSHTPYGAVGTYAKYRVGFNPQVLDLNPNGDTVSMEDTLSNIQERESAVLDNTSVKVYSYSKASSVGYSHSCASLPVLGNYTSHVNAMYQCGVSKESSYSRLGYSSQISSTIPSYASLLSPDSYTVHWDSATHTLTIDGLPDGSQLWVEYALIFNSTASSVSPTNTAMLAVDGVPSSLQKATSTNTIPIYKSAAVANISGVFVRKVQEDKPSIVVSGAQYELQKYDGTQFVHDRDFTTTDSTVTLDQLECGTAYRIKETVAPAGYELNSEPYDFKLKACENPTGRVPADWSGVDHIVMDTLTVSDRKQPSTSTMPVTGSIPWLYLLLGAGLASMLGASLLLSRKQ